MPLYGFNVLKRTAFRGGLQHFGNTYYYDVTTTDSDTTGLERILDEIVRIEKTLHSTAVAFVQGRVWSAHGTPAQNQMLVDKPLTGSGSKQAQANMDRERAALIQFRAGADSRGRPVYLRKWFHICGRLGLADWGSDQLAQTATVGPEQKGVLEDAGNELKAIDLIDAPAAELRGPTGRQITGATVAHPWLEHRQFGDEWRGT